MHITSEWSNICCKINIIHLLLLGNRILLLFFFPSWPAHQQIARIYLNRFWWGVISKLRTITANNEFWPVPHIETTFLAMRWDYYLKCCSLQHLLVFCGATFSMSIYFRTKLIIMYNKSNCLATLSNKQFCIFSLILGQNKIHFLKM